MRVLLTTDTVGGVWTFTRELTAELLRLGHAVALVSFGRRPSCDQAAWCSLTARRYPRSFRYEASPAPLEWMPENEAAYSAGESLLLRLVREFAPDLLHSSQFCFGRLPVALPKLITAHSDVLSWGDACKPGGLEASAWLATYCGLVQRGLDGADAVVAPTRWMLDALGRSFALPQHRSVVLNGRTLPQTNLVLSRKMQAVAAGRIWDEGKNLGMLNNLDSPVRILIAGEPNIAAEPALDSAIPSDNIDSVQRLGLLSEADLIRLLCCSSFYIITSIYEPFGLAALEAALCGCAVLANDIPSLREVWGEAALYFHDKASLCRLLEELSSSPRALRAARARALSRTHQLSAARMATEYIEFYKELLNTDAPHISTVRTEEKELAVYAN